MIKMYTQEDIIRYIYGETTAEESLKIENQMFHDTDSLSFYLEVLELLSSLDTVMKNPSDKVIEAILAYSSDKNHHSSDLVPHTAYRS